jgi:hypothetical protein
MPIKLNREPAPRPVADPAITAEMEALRTEIAETRQRITSDRDRELALAEIDRMKKELQQMQLKESDMQHPELGSLTDAEIQLIRQARGSAAGPQQKTQDQETAEKRARFQKLMGMSAGKWTPEDQRFMQQECMGDLLSNRLPFGL